MLGRMRASEKKRGLRFLAPGRRQKKKEEKDRFFYVGIVDKKTKMELEIPVPPSLTKY